MSIPVPEIIAAAKQGILELLLEAVVQRLMASRELKREWVGGRRIFGRIFIAGRNLENRLNSHSLNKIRAT